MDTLNSDNSDELASASKEDESALDYGADFLIGIRLTTEYGAGSIEDTREYDGTQFCVIRLCYDSGTVSLPLTTVQATVKEEVHRRGPVANVVRSFGLHVPSLVGHIRLYTPSKGWGFITSDAIDGDIFMHSKHFADDSLQKISRPYRERNDRARHFVKFDLDLHTWNRPQAVSVRYLEQLSSPSEPEEQLSAATDLPIARISANAKDVVADPAISSELFVNAEDELEDAQDKRVLRVRGLPFNATEADVAQFFDGFGVLAEHVKFRLRSNGSPSGVATVRFAREELALKAYKERNFQHMGQRYIELFPAESLAAEQPQMWQGYDVAGGMDMQQHGWGLSRDAMQPGGYGAYADYGSYDHTGGTATLSASAAPFELQMNSNSAYGAAGSAGPAPDAVEAAQAARQQRMQAEAYAQYCQAFQEAFVAAAAERAASQAYAGSMAGDYENSAAPQSFAAEMQDVQASYDQYQYQDYQNQ